MTGPGVWDEMGFFAWVALLHLIVAIPLLLAFDFYRKKAR